jgi:hypothetical protein
MTVYFPRMRGEGRRGGEREKNKEAERQRERERNRVREYASNTELKEYF